MRPLLAVLLVACAADSEETTTPPPIPTSLSIYDRLHDDAGPIAGMPGFSVVHAVDPTRCGGIASRVQLGTSDEPLADVLAIAFPSGLDFSQPNKAQSLNRFDAWVKDMSQRGNTARTAYSTRITASDATAAQRAIAAARIVQLQRHIATQLVRAEIPLDVRSGEHADDKIGAFCDRMHEVAEPIVIMSEGAAKACLEHARTAGWWTRVCSLASMTAKR